MKNFFVVAMLCAITASASAQDNRPLRKRHTQPAVGDANLLSKVDATRAIGVSIADVIVPYIVDGGGYRTTIRLTNLENRDATIELFFIGDDGQPTSVALTGGRQVAGLRGTLPPLAMTTIQTEGIVEESQITWSFFTAGDARVAATVTIDEKSGENWRGSTYPASSFIAKKAIAVFDHTDGSDSQISLANIATTEVVVTAIIRGTDGKEIFKEDLTLGPLNAIGYSPIDAVPELKGRRGTVEFTIPAATRGGVGVLTTRFFDAGGIDNLPAVTPQ